MSQLEQIEARADEAERRRDRAANSISTAAQASELVFGGAHVAYTQAAALARPLQEAVDAMRCNIWTLFECEARQLGEAIAYDKKTEIAHVDGWHLRAESHKRNAKSAIVRANAYGQAARMLHESLEKAGLC